jgi:hypothetical protein
MQMNRSPSPCPCKSKECLEEWEKDMRAYQVQKSKKKLSGVYRDGEFFTESKKGNGHPGR